jgi:hypothetical protein
MAGDERSLISTSGLRPQTSDLGRFEVELWR